VFKPQCLFKEFESSVLHFNWLKHYLNKNASSTSVLNKSVMQVNTFNFGKFFLTFTTTAKWDRYNKNWNLNQTFYTFYYKNWKLCLNWIFFKSSWLRKQMLIIVINLYNPKIGFLIHWAIGVNLKWIIKRVKV